MSSHNIISFFYNITSKHIEESVEGEDHDVIIIDVLFSSELKKIISIFLRHG